MRSNSLNKELNNDFSRAYSSTLNKPSAFNHNSQLYYNINHNPQLKSTDDFHDTVAMNELFSSPTSLYDNHCDDIVKTDICRETSRKSRLNESCLTSHKNSLKRDLSMPPINDRQRQYIDENLSSQYTYSHHKYSIDGSLNVPPDDDSSTDLYDSVITSVSVTPPPVHMIHEYVNRKAIIRPLAFRPIQPDRSHNASESSPTKPPAFTKNKVIQPKRSSPPPVPPHSGRIPLKSNLGRVQSLKSGDSSGYYSSRTVGTTNGNTSSTDISPTFDDNGSMMDSILTGEIYANTIDMINDYHITDGADQEPFVIQSSLESEIAMERERNLSLEAALSLSNAKQINAESQINDIKMRLVQKSSEVNKVKETLSLVKRSLEHHMQKSQSLEKSLKSLQVVKHERSKDVVMKEKATQTNLYNVDNNVNKLLEQFEDERRTWLDEKLKVLTYQKQIETNFQKLQIKCRRLDAQLTHVKSQMNECRTQPSQSSNHFDDHEKSSMNSADSANRNYFSNTNRGD